MFENILFILSAVLTIISAVFVVATRDILHACVYLLGSLIGVAGLYLTLGADFIAATQLMVYVGGVIILMLFAVMLTGGKNLAKEAQGYLKNNPLMGGSRSYAWAILMGTVFAFSLTRLLSGALTLHDVGEIIPNEATTHKIGEALVGKHVLVFELSSVLLLGALVGAAMIARPDKKGTGEKND